MRADLSRHGARPLSRRHPHQALEVPMELALVVEADSKRHLGLRHSGGEQLLRETDPPVRDVGVRRQAYLLAKCPAEPELGEAR